MADYFVLHVQRYDFQDRSGQFIRGISVIYLDQPFRDNNSKGWAPLKVTADSSLWGAFGAIPGRYEMDFRQKPDAKGKPTLALVAVRPSFASDDAFDQLERELLEPAR